MLQAPICTVETILPFLSGVLKESNPEITVRHSNPAVKRAIRAPGIIIFLYWPTWALVFWNGKAFFRFSVCYFQSDCGEL